MDAEKKKQIITRLNNIEGHIRGIKRMVEDDAYCIDIMNQVRAVQMALEKVNAITLENHMNTCVTTAVRSDNPKERERVIQEIIDVFKKTGKL